MSVFRLVFFVLASLSASDVWAACIDLSGTYLCDGEVSTVARSTDGQGASVYTFFTASEEWRFVADAETPNTNSDLANFLAVCDERGLVVYNARRDRIWALEFSLDGQKSLGMVLYEGRLGAGESIGGIDIRAKDLVPDSESDFCERL